LGTHDQPKEGPAEDTSTRFGHANYTTMEEIPKREKVHVGMFFLDEHPIIILFHSGASHDFISSTCANKAKLSLMTSGEPYVISNPGCRVDADWIVQKVLLELSERVLVPTI
jgi:hypothetical protein